MIVRVVRFVLMLLHLSMHIITLITTLVPFLDVTMEMCIRSCTRKHGRILWMIQLFLMALKSIFNPCLSNNYAMLDCKKFILNAINKSVKFCGTINKIGRSYVQMKTIFHLLASLFSSQLGASGTAKTYLLH